MYGPVMNYGNKFDVKGRLALDIDALYHLYEQLPPLPTPPLACTHFALIDPAAEDT